MNSELQEFESYPLASAMSRLLANLIDAIPGIVICSIIGIVFVITLAASDSDTAAGVLTICTVLAFPFIICWAIYNIYLVAKYGQTFGKRMLRLKMVRVSDDSTIDVGRWLFLRTLIPNALSSATFGLFGIIDILFIFGDKRQCLHDMIADTKVIELPNKN